MQLVVLHFAYDDRRFHYLVPLLSSLSFHYQPNQQVILDIIIFIINYSVLSKILAVKICMQYIYEDGCVNISKG